MGCSLLPSVLKCQWLWPQIGGNSFGSVQLPSAHRERVSALRKFLLNKARQMEKTEVLFKNPFLPVPVISSAVHSPVSLPLSISQGEREQSRTLSLVWCVPPSYSSIKPPLDLPGAHLSSAGLPPEHGLVATGLLAAAFYFLSVLYPTPKRASGQHPDLTWTSPWVGMSISSSWQMCFAVRGPGD